MHNPGHKSGELQIRNGNIFKGLIIMTKKQELKMLIAGRVSELDNLNQSIVVKKSALTILNRELAEKRDALKEIENRISGVRSALKNITPEE